MKVVLNKEFLVDRIVVDVKHGKKDFVRLASEQIAKALVEQGCLLTQTQYSMEHDAYYTCVTVLVGNKERVLP